MSSGYGVGASLASIGQGVERQGLAEYRAAADADAKREAENTMIRANEKAGRQQLGATVGSLAGGAIAGSAAGPWGALIGGVVGYLAGGI